MLRILILMMLMLVLTGCRLCSVRVYSATVKLTPGGKLCLMISPDDFDRDSRFMLAGVNIYRRDETGKVIRDSVVDVKKPTIISPGECLYADFNHEPGKYEFDFTTGEENDLTDFMGRERWIGRFVLSVDKNGGVHLVDGASGE